MNKLVVISGGFHPFHAGHMALYTAAKEAFPDAQVVIGATNAQKDRPFPFKIKQKLAQVSGVPPKDFVEVTRQFSAEDPAIASRIKNPNDTILIFARSEKDKGEPPLPAQPDPKTGQLPLVTRGPNKGKPVSNYLQYFAGNEDNLEPMTQHAYMAYLPTVEFGPGITSASEIRAAWPTLNDKRKTAMVMSLYPTTQKNPKLAASVVKLMDAGMGEQTVTENDTDRFKKYIRPVVKTEPKIERTTNPAGRTTDHVEWKVTTPTGEIHRYKSKKQAQEHFDSFSKQGIAEGKVKLYTDPGYFGAEIDDTGFDNLPIINISANQLVGFEPDSKMNQPKSRANVEKIVAGLKQGAKLPPLLVRKYKNGYQVLDGHHRFWAYKLLGVKSIPSRIVPDEDIEEISKQGVAEGITADMRDFFAKEKPSKQLMSPKVYRGTTDYLNQQKQQSKEQSELAYLKVLLHTAMVARQQGKSLNSVMRQQDIAKLVMAKADGTLDKITVKEQGIEEARRNPEQNVKLPSGMKELQAIAKTISDPENWAISMTSLPKLGINPQVGISEDTPKGIYFYPLDYAVDKTRYGKLPWGDNYPYIQLFQYDRSGEMTQQTKVDPTRLKQALLQYCPEEVIQQAIDEPEYDGTPYWTIYDCLSRLGKSDETNVVRWNKVLRDLGFTSVYDPGKGWIAYNEPTQGVVLDPRIIKQHKTISNRQEARVVTPTKIEQAIFDTMDMELASNRAWQKYDPDSTKLRAAAKEYAKDPKFKPWFGKPGTEEIYDKAKGLGRYGARQLSDEAWDWYKDSKKNPITAMTETNITKHMDYLEEK